MAELQQPLLKDEVRVRITGTMSVKGLAVGIIAGLAHDGMAIATGMGHFASALLIKSLVEAEERLRSGSVPAGLRGQRLVLFVSEEPEEDNYHTMTKGEYFVTEPTKAPAAPIRVPVTKDSQVSLLATQIRHRLQEGREVRLNCVSTWELHKAIKGISLGQIFLQRAEGLENVRIGIRTEKVSKTHEDGTSYSVYRLQVSKVSQWQPFKMPKAEQEELLALSREAAGELESSDFEVDGFADDDKDRPMRITQNVTVGGLASAIVIRLLEERRALAIGMGPEASSMMIKAMVQAEQQLRTREKYRRLPGTEVVAFLSEGKDEAVDRTTMQAHYQLCSLTLGEEDDFNAVHFKVAGKTKPSSLANAILLRSKEGKEIILDAHGANSIHQVLKSVSLCQVFLQREPGCEKARIGIRTTKAFTVSKDIAGELTTFYFRIIRFDAPSV